MADPKECGQMLEAYRKKGMYLAEKKWSKLPGKMIRGYSDEKIDFLEGIEDPYKRAMVAQLLENTHDWINGLDESTRMLAVGSFEKFVFPIVRAMMANLVASDLVTVQPLDAPTGLIFYLDAIYGSNKGNINQGTKMFDARTGPSRAYQYTGEKVEQERLGTGGGGVANYTGNFTWTPVRAGTVVITDGTQTVRDNGNGALLGDVGAASTINYATGAYDVTFAANVAADAAILVDYEFNAEGTAMPQLDIQLTSSPVTARKNGLSATWSYEAQQDFQQYHGVNAEVEIVALMANEIAKEINYKIIRHIYDVASAGNVVWDNQPPAGVPWIWHKESLYDKLVIGSNSIFYKTQRARANWIVAGVDVCNVLMTLSKFQKTGGGDQGAGVQKLGTIGEFDAYIDPSFERTKFVMGHKGTSFLDTGYVYAPYLALFTTPTVMLEDMIARKGMAQRTALKVVNSGMYCTGEIENPGVYTPEVA